ncbi:MAG TPA: NnrS family protein [Burkholderiaceae bacterium]|nr:NnrS family protein [Burkholderiaceae bacterium]
MTSIPSTLDNSMPTTTARPQWRAFLSLGFRPLYFAGCAWAAVAIAIWIFAPGLLKQPLGGLAWHAHEMLWGFVATIAVGFLLTASANWTKTNPLHGWPLAVLVSLWLVARIGYLAGGRAAFLLAGAAETAFFVVAGVAVLRVVIMAGSRRNYGIPLLLFGLATANVLYLRAAQQGDYAELMRRFDLGLLCMAVIALLIARRVIPFFTMRMVQGLSIPMNTRSGQAQITLGLVAILTGMVGFYLVMAAALAATGLIGLYQIVAWRPLASRHRPILWILYLGYAMLSLGLVSAAIYLVNPVPGVLARAATHVHIIGVGGFSILIIGMVTRTALGHLGRPLKLDASMRVSYLTLIIATALRLAALPATGPANLWLLRLAAAFWIATFVLYLWRFAPMLIRPRPDAARS